jgi:membrane associated rhomboid family serine protease
MNQMMMPVLTKLNKTIIGIVVGIFLVNSLLSLQSISLNYFLSLGHDSFFSGHIYQILTYAFTENTLMGAIFNSLLFWFIGSELEGKWGTNFYLKFILINIILVAVLYLITAAIFPLRALSGTQVICYSLLTAYAMIYSERSMLFMFVFPLPAKIFCLIIAALELYMAIFSSSGWAGIIPVFSMPLTYFGLKLLSARARGELSPWKKISKERQKSKFKIIKNDDEDGPRYWQ